MKKKKKNLHILDMLKLPHRPDICVVQLLFVIQRDLWSNILFEFVAFKFFLIIVEDNNALYYGKKKEIEIPL